MFEVAEIWVFFTYSHSFTISCPIKIKAKPEIPLRNNHTFGCKCCFKTRKARQLTWKQKYGPGELWRNRGWFKSKHTEASAEAHCHSPSLKLLIYEHKGSLSGSLKQTTTSFIYNLCKRYYIWIKQLSTNRHTTVIRKII